MTLANSDQKDFWTDQAGPTWVAQMRATDAAFAPVLTGLLERADLAAGADVLDVGCGAGTSTLAISETIGPNGKVTGVDISATLLQLAHCRVKANDPVEFLLADAQTYTFDEGRADTLVSRFGLMFFEDNTAAFANMFHSLRPGGQICFATWGPIPDNPYFTLPAAMAKKEFGPMPKSDPDAPGPFAMRDMAMVERVLDTAGFTNIVAQNEAIDLTPVGTPDDLAQLMFEIGPAERALAHFNVDQAGREAFHEKLAAALEPYNTDQGLRFPASINYFTARKPA